MKKIKHTVMLALMVMLAFTQANAQCPVPSGLSSVTLSTASSQLNWAAMAGSAGYNIEVQNGQNNPTVFLVTGNPVSNTFAVNGLTGGFAYKFKVRTVCGGSKSNWSSWFTFVAGGGAINCVQLTGLVVSGTTANGATFNWNASPGGLGYSVRIEDATGNPVNFASSANTINNTYTKTGLNPASNYKVKIRKRCAVGVAGPWSPWVFFTTNALRLAASNENISSADNISVYPNPASDVINVNIIGSADEKIKSVDIYDLAGKLIHSEIIDATLQGNSYTVSTLGIENGIYLLSLQTANMRTSRKVFVAK